MGKTTTAVNLSSCMALAEKRTLLVDLDPQANASSGLGIRLSSKQASVYDLLLGQGQVAQVVQRTALDFLDLLASSQDLIGAEVELVSMDSRENVLKIVPARGSRVL